MAKILVVEDNLYSHDMLRRRLIRKGYDAIVAVDGRQGVELAQSEGPDIILMDMNLPEMDGWEATRIIKSMDATRSIPIIALTAHAMSGDRAKCFEAGCDDYDTKPIDFPKLLEKIQKLLERKCV
ncbi:MAG: two-component system response regulator [bacterium]|nr:MAG: two-component system response regulator [bacterium]